jgi:hypothetical protein
MWQLLGEFGIIVLKGAEMLQSICSAADPPLFHFSDPTPNNTRYDADAPPHTHNLNPRSPQHISFLCLTLVSELNSVFQMAGKLAVVGGSTSPLAARAARALRAADRFTFVPLRLLPHAVMGLTVVRAPAVHRATSCSSKTTLEKVPGL